MHFNALEVHVWEADKIGEKNILTYLVYVDLDVGYLLFISIAIEIHFDFIFLILTLSLHCMRIFIDVQPKMVSLDSNIEANVALCLCVCDLFFSLLIHLTICNHTFYTKWIKTYAQQQHTTVLTS